MSQETELKLLVAPDDHDAILSAPCLKSWPAVTLHLTNTYFDDASRSLNRERVALRIREINGQYIQTLKTKGQSVNGLSRRGEWEWILESPELDGNRLASVWPEALQGTDVSALEPVFRTDFERRVIDLEWEGAKIELALDHGYVIAGPKQAVISELELELKQGDEQALHSLAKELRLRVKLEPGDISKAERGYRLIS